VTSVLSTAWAWLDHDAATKPPARRASNQRSAGRAFMRVAFIEVPKR
jgi:hypothetical protein